MIHIVWVHLILPYKLFAKRIIFNIFFFLEFVRLLYRCWIADAWHYWHTHTHETDLRISILMLFFKCFRLTIRHSIFRLQISTEWVTTFFSVNPVALRFGRIDFPGFYNNWFSMKLCVSLTIISFFSISVKNGYTSDQPQVEILIEMINVNKKKKKKKTRNGLRHCKIRIECLFCTKNSRYTRRTYRNANKHFQSLVAHECPIATIAHL